MAAPGLQELHLFIYSHAPSFGALFSPLLSLHGMRSFVCTMKARGPQIPAIFMTAHDLTGCDADFAAAARAWPALETFRIVLHRQTWMADCQTVPSPTVLSHFRHWCPRLINIELPPLELGPCGTEDEGILQLTPGEASLGMNHSELIHPLERLKIQAWRMKGRDIPEGQKAKWEEYLLRLFPRLTGPSKLEGSIIVGELPDGRR